MQRLLLAPSGFRSLIHGDFNASRTSDILWIPAELYSKLRTLNIQTVPEFLSVCSVNPSALALALGWTIDEVRLAHAKLTPLFKT